MRIYMDNVSVYTVAGSSLNTYVSATPGSHFAVVQAWDTTGAVFKSQETINVSGTVVGGVTVSAPTNGASTASPIQFVASAHSSNPITAMRIYLDNTSVYTVGASSLNTSVPAAPGAHTAVVQAWDSTGAVFKSSLSLNVTAPVTNPISVSITPATAALQAGGSQQFSASVSNATNTAVNWSVNGVSGGNATAGTVSSSGLYKAPTSATSNTAVTLTATSVADSTKSASARVTVSPAPTAVAVTVSPATASVGAGASQQFTAVVTGTSNTGTTWFVNGVQGGNAAAGTISTSGLYTAPACASASTVTVTARSVYDSSATASATVSLAGGSSSSQDYFVSTSGSDSNNGSSCSPWATIGHAAATVGAGATVYVEPGSYSGSYVYFNKSGTASSHIRFIGQGYNMSTRTWGVKLSITPDSYSRLLVLYGSYIEIVGMDITTPNQTGSAGGIRSTGKYNRMAFNYVHDVGTQNASAAAGCFDLGTGGDYATVENNFCDHSGPDPSLMNNNHQHGVYVAANYATVRNNIFGNVSGKCIQVYNTETVFPAGSIIANNVGYYCRDGLVVSGTNSVVVNNIFYGNKNNGIYEYPATPAGANNKYYNNLLFANGSGNTVSLQSSNGTGAVQSGTIAADPQFLNYQNDGSGDYRTKPTSPAINAGTTLDVPAIDIVGNPRPQGSGIDIGAYQE